MKHIFSLIFILSFFILPITASAMDVAPRISDREIVEKLSRIEATQNSFNNRFDDINNRFDDMNQSVNQRFDDMNNRFDDMNNRFDDMNQSVNQRFDDINQRLSDQNQTMLTLFAAMISLILALFAYIAWDRRTMLKPIMEKINNLEKDLTNDLELNNKAGSIPTRLLKAMRELARTNEDVATVLRNLSLL